MQLYNSMMLSIRIVPENCAWYLFPVPSPKKLYLNRIFFFCSLSTTSYLVFSSGAISTSSCFWATFCIFRRTATCAATPYFSVKVKRKDVKIQSVPSPRGAKFLGFVKILPNRQLGVALFYFSSKHHSSSPNQA